MEAPTGVDPREILGVPPDASGAEITAAFRRLAKRWHPDRAGSDVAADQMALVNAAYAALRAPAAPAPAPPSSAPGGPAADPPGSVAGDDLAPAVRRALGHELRAALQPGETVGIVVPAATWASPQTVLVVTDRRLLWLLDDVPVHRVRWWALADLRHVHVRPPRPWRRRALLVCEDRHGRRQSFGELAPATAEAIARRLRPPDRPTTGRHAG